MTHEHIELPDELERLKEYHGHLGPYAIVGYVASRIALERLRARRHFGVKARVECEPVTPQSCIVDGVQVGAGCTYGKRNIELHAAPEVAVHFENTDTSEKCCLRLRPEMPAQFKEWLDQLGDERAAIKAFELGPDLFLP